MSTDFTTIAAGALPSLPTAARPVSRPASVQGDSPVFVDTKTGTVPPAPQDPKLRKAFDAFVGEAFYGQMLKSMRKSLGKPAYFHGGRTEEVFQQQLDQVLATKLSDASADKLSGPMFELFTLARR